MPNSSPIYLDHNATTPVLPAVVEAMLPYLHEHFGNPSSGHSFGQRARAAVDVAREQVAELLGCAHDEVLFTSGGTEANNLAIRGVADDTEKRGLITSKVEHPATAAPCRYLEKHGWSVEWMDVDRDGRVLVEGLRERLSDQTALVTIMHANNETGVLQPIREIADAAHEQGALVHTDAAQSVGKIPARVHDLGVDLLSVAGHKLNAPKGVGALFVRRGTPLHPFVLGAGHERGLRPGTENVASIVGFGVACELAGERLAATPYAIRELRDRFWQRLQRAIPGIALHGHESERLPNTLNVGFPGTTGSSVLAATPQIAASTGSACHDGGEVASSVLLAMGVDAGAALGTVRLSLGCTTTAEDVDDAVDALTLGWRRACKGP
jgi:cysteine desulfurase